MQGIISESGNLCSELPIGLSQTTITCEIQHYQIGGKQLSRFYVLSVYQLSLSLSLNSVSKPHVVFLRFRDVLLVQVVVVDVHPQEVLGHEVVALLGVARRGAVERTAEVLVVGAGLK